MARHEQVGEAGHHIHLTAVLEHSPQPGLLKAELPFDHAERMLHFWPKVSLCRLDQVINASLVCIWYGLIKLNSKNSNHASLAYEAEQDALLSRLPQVS
jgi:hypothetical protein